MIALPADDFDESLEPAIFVEPKDGRLGSEEHRQASYIVRMRQYARHVLVAGIPNGAKRSNWEAAKARREGMLKGFPDTVAVWPGVTAYIEFKSGKGNPDPQQIHVLNRLARAGHPVAICRTPEGAMAWLRGLGAPVPQVRG